MCRWLQVDHTASHGPLQNLQPVWAAGPLLWTTTRTRRMLLQCLRLLACLATGTLQPNLLPSAAWSLAWALANDVKFEVRFPILAGPLAFFLSDAARARGLCRRRADLLLCLHEPDTLSLGSVCWTLNGPTEPRFLDPATLPVNRNADGRFQCLCRKATRRQGLSPAAGLRTSPTSWFRLWCRSLALLVDRIARPVVLCLGPT
jgi:hypothetical protein